MPIETIEPKIDKILATLERVEEVIKALERVLSAPPAPKPEQADKGKSH